MLEYELPWVFYLLPLPALVYFLVPGANLRESSPLRVPFYQKLQHFEANAGKSRASGLSQIISLLIIWILLIIATARPVWLGEEVILPAEGRDLMLAVDISGSMRVEDMSINDEAIDRLSLVKLVLTDFIEKRSGDRLGLILFGSNAYLQTPLTFDQATLTQFLLEAEIGLAGESTAIGDAIGLAIKRIHERPSDSRVLILLTDGSNNAGQVEPLQAARLAKEKSLKIYTVGIGAESMEQPGIFGSSFFSRTINPSADLDESTLKKIADLTGGRYFRATDSQSLQEIYQILDQLEQIEAENLSYRPKQTLFYWFLGAALSLSALLALWSLLQPILLNQLRQKPKEHTPHG